MQSDGPPRARLPHRATRHPYQAGESRRRNNCRTAGEADRLVIQTPCPPPWRLREVASQPSDSNPNPTFALGLPPAVRGPQTWSSSIHKCKPYLRLPSAYRGIACRVLLPTALRLPAAWGLQRSAPYTVQAGRGRGRGRGKGSIVERPDASIDIEAVVEEAEAEEGSSCDAVTLVDGGEGEGGGQILRIGAALAAITGGALNVVIRAALWNIPLTTPEGWGEPPY